MAPEAIARVVDDTEVMEMAEPVAAKEELKVVAAGSAAAPMAVAPMAGPAVVGGCLSALAEGSQEEATLAVATEGAAKAVVTWVMVARVAAVRGMGPRAEVATAVKAVVVVKANRAKGAAEEAAAVMGRVTLGKVAPAMAVGVEEEDVEVVPQVGAAAVAVEMATRTARVVVSKGG